jgi:hypothetical protein
MAARDGAMTVYHFSGVIDAIKKSQKNTPTLRALVDGKRIRAAGRQFKVHFPQFEQIRHAIAHDAEFAATPELKRKHRSPEDKITLEGHELTIGDSFDAETVKFCTSIDGHRVSYELSRASLNNLIAVQREVYGAFNKAFRHCKRSPRPAALQF